MTTYNHISGTITQIDDHIWLGGVPPNVPKKKKTTEKKGAVYNLRSRSSR